MAQGAEDCLRTGDQRAPGLRYGGNRWIWVFGTEFGVETRFEKKQPDRTCRLFSPNLYKKSQVWAFGTDFERIWSFQISGYFDVWPKKRIMAGTQCGLHKA